MPWYNDGEYASIGGELEAQLCSLLLQGCAAYNLDRAKSLLIRHELVASRRASNSSTGCLKTWQLSNFCCLFMRIIL